MKKVRYKTKSNAKTASAVPSPGQPSLDAAPLSPVAKRGRGRPRKVDPFKPLDGSKDPETETKALTVFRRMTADAEKLGMTQPEFDGGGTKQDAPTITKEGLERRVARRLNVLDRFLTDDKLIELLSFSSLKEIGIYEGIMLDKSLVLKGQPNVIIGNEDRQAIDLALPRLMDELKRRGLIARASERSVEIRTVDQKP